MEICKMGMFPDDPNYLTEHAWGRARRAAKDRDHHKCITCGSTEYLEVNHITPRLGKSIGIGCHNHLENLETLCRDCHRMVTRAQRREYGWGIHIEDEVTVDGRQRMSLGQWASPHTRIYTVEVLDTGQIILRPGVIVTDPEVVRGS